MSNEWGTGCRAAWQGHAGRRRGALDHEVKAWLDLHYGYPIEELTFGGIIARNPMARTLIAKLLTRTHRRLLALAAKNPDLAAAYKARAEIFAERVRIFDPAFAIRLSERHRAEAIDIMDRMERTLDDGRATMVPPAHGIVDTVLTVFLGRMEFAALGAEIPKRVALVRYWRTPALRGCGHMDKVPSPPCGQRRSGRRRG